MNFYWAFYTLKIEKYNISIHLLQRFSIYGSWITCGPRDLPLWPFKKKKKTEEKLKFKWIVYHTKISEFENDTWQSFFAFSPSTDVLWNLLPYPSSIFPLYSEQKKKY